MEQAQHAADPSQAPAAALETPDTGEYHEILPTERSPWLNFLLSNWAVPLALLAVVGLGQIVDNSDYINSYYRRIIYLSGISVIMAVSLQLINGVSGQFSLGHAGFMALGAYLSAYPLKTQAGTDSQNPAGLLLYYLALFAVLIMAAVVLVMLFRIVRLSGRVHSSLPGILLLLLAAWVIADIAAAGRYDPLPPWLLWTQGTRLLTRTFEWITTSAAQPAAALSEWLPGGDLRGSISFLIAILGGGVCAAIAGLVVGLPTLRLRGDYLAIATLGFAEIIRVAINNSVPLGRSTGLRGIVQATNFAWIFCAAIITIVVVWRITYSAKGRSIAAVREDEIAAAAVGIDTTHHKVLAFIVGAFFAGVGGALFAHMNFIIQPSQFDFMRSVELVVMVTLGGLGSISGAIVTAVILTTAPEMLRQFEKWRMVIYSALLIAMMLLRPQGILGHRELWPRRWLRPRSRAARAKEVPA